MGIQPRIELEYPFSRMEAGLRLLFAALLSFLYLFLAFRTVSFLFHIGFITAFLLLAFTLPYRMLRFRQMMRVVKVGNEYRKERIGGYVELFRYLVYLLLPLLIFPLLDPAFAFGCFLGYFSSICFSDVLFYLYVRKVESRYNGDLRAFIEPSDKPGRYVWGLRLHSQGVVDER